MTFWDFCAWIGVITLAIVAVRTAHFAVETFIVVRIGWDGLEELGFWRAIPVAIRVRSRQ